MFLFVNEKALHAQYKSLKLLQNLGGILLDYFNLQIFMYTYILRYMYNFLNGVMP